MKKMPYINIRNEWLLFWCGMLLTLVIVGGLYFYMQKERDRDIAALSSNYTVRIESIMNKSFHKTDIFKSVIVMNDGQISNEQFNDLAASIYDNTPGIRAMQLLPQGIVRYCFPLLGNERVMGLNILEDPRRAAGTKMVVEKRDIVLSGPYVLTQGGIGVIATNPIFLHDEAGQEYLWGFSVIVLDLPDAIDTAALEHIKDAGYEYQLYSINELGEKLVIAGNQDMDLSDAYESRLEVPHNHWTLALRPTYLGRNHLLLLMIFGFGLIINILLAYAYRASLRARSLQAKSQLMSRVSHELRTPMNAIIGFSNLGRESNDAAEMKYYLSRISESTDYLLGLINDVLDMGGLMENKIVLTPKPYKLKELQRWIKDMFRVRALQKRIILDIKLENDSECALMLDKSRFEQVAANLVDNAIRYTEVGGNVCVTIAVTGQTKNQAEIVFSVKDNGIGISKEFQQRMFEPFEQEDSSKTKADNGNGLGLSIVQKIVGIMNGSITCNSAKGIGTEFIVTLQVPVLQGDAMEWQLQHNDYSGLKGRRILLAEDHPINVKIAVRLLERQGMVIDTAANGQLAVDMFNESAVSYYDAILMDIRMPVMDGLTAAKAVRALPRPDAPIVPIIAVTANAYEEDKRQSYEAGMNAHLPKPLEALKLYDMLVYFIIKENE